MGRSRRGMRRELAGPLPAENITIWHIIDWAEGNRCDERRAYGRCGHQACDTATQVADELRSQAMGDGSLGQITEARILQWARRRSCHNRRCNHRACCAHVPMIGYLELFFIQPAKAA